MNEPKRDDQCIERCGPAGRREFFSVVEYDQRLARGRFLTSPYTRTSEGLYWTNDALDVEELTTEWQQPNMHRFRICDWDVYDEQMRLFIGIA